MKPMGEFIAELLQNPFVQLLAYFGIPAYMIRRFEKRQDAKEKREEEKEKNREEMNRLQVKTTMASIALGEATARAVQRIPDAHCNGDMTKALEYVATVKHEEKDFLTGLGIHALYEE